MVLDPDVPMALRSDGEDRPRFNPKETILEGALKLETSTSGMSS